MLSAYSCSFDTTTVNYYGERIIIIMIDGVNV